MSGRSTGRDLGGRALPDMHPYDIERDYGTAVASVVVDLRDVRARYDTILGYVDDLLNVQTRPSKMGVKLVETLDAILKDPYGERR